MSLIWRGGVSVINNNYKKKRMCHELEKPFCVIPSEPSKSHGSINSNLYHNRLRHQGQFVKSLCEKNGQQQKVSSKVSLRTAQVDLGPILFLQIH